MSKYQDLEGKLNSSTDFLGVLSLGGVVLSGILLLTPVRAVGYIGMGSGIGTFTASIVTRKKHLEVAKQQIDNLSNQQRSEVLKKDDTISQLNSTVDVLSSQVKSFEIDAKTQVEELSKTQKQIESLTVQNQSKDNIIEKVTAELERLIALARTVVEESLDEWETKLSSLETKREQYPKLTERLNALLDEGQEKLADYALKLAQTPSKWDSLGDLLNLYYCLHDDLQNVKIKAVQAISKLTVQEKEVRIDELEDLIIQWQESNLVPREKLESIIKNCEARLKEFHIEYSQRFDGVIDVAKNFEEGLKGDEEFFLRLRMEIQRLEAENQRLQALLKECHQLKYFDDVGWKSEAANKVLYHFQLNEIVCDASPLPIREVGGELEFYIVPRTRLGMNLVKGDIEKVAESIQIPLGSKIKIAIEGKSLRVRIPFENREAKKISPEDILNRAVSTWAVYVGSEYHLVIFAATQSGKSSLADELNALQYSQLEGQIQFRAITLKNDGNRDEQKTRRFVAPQFMSSNQEYMESLADIHEAIDSRNRILQVNPSHVFPRQIFQLDEYGEYYRLGQPEEKSAGKEAVISLLQRGAGLSSEMGKGISLTLIAQNPYVSLLGLNKPDFANACIIIVGEKNIRLFLDSDPANHGLDDDDLERLDGELKLFKEASRIASEKAAKEAEKRGEDLGIAIRKCSENYYSLIIPSKGGLPPVILYNPQPGEFTNGLIDNSKTPKPTCPDCGTESDKVCNKAKSRYFCLNDACKRKTFTWKGV